MLLYLLPYQEMRKQVQAENNRRPLGASVSHHHLLRLPNSSSSSLRCRLILTTFPNTLSITELTILLPGFSSFEPLPRHDLPTHQHTASSSCSCNLSCTFFLSLYLHGSHQVCNFLVAYSKATSYPSPPTSPSSTPVLAASPSNASSSRYHLLSPRSHPPASSSFF